MKRIFLTFIIVLSISSVSCDDYLDDLALQIGLNEGLVAYWPVTESSGFTIKDESLNGNNIVLTNTADQYFSSGVFQNALLFGGSSRLGTVFNNTLLDQGNMFSISFWIKITGSNIDYGNNIFFIFDKIHITYNPAITKLNFMIADSTTAQYSIESDIISNQWFYLTTVYDGSVMSVYVNGNHAISSVKNCILGKPNNNVNIAPNGYQDRVPMEGLIDEIRIYNRALSQKEIQALMKIGID
ncbi:MAG: hypothetical protein CVV49_16365 [Spirochaetae bacterium HGW-Spirochaetae-5]|nr:MAG: hypothetical protein CVV49_16365 [Spirochaetae bacterium HGW-Spirochaetae-5]